MKVRVQLTEEDYVSTLWLSIRSNRKLATIFVGVAMVILGSSIYNVVCLLRGGSVALTEWVPAILGGLVAWSLVIATPSKMRKTFRAQKLHEKPSEVELAEERLISTNDQGHTAMKWQDVLKWCRTQKMIIVYLTEQQCVMLPRHAFTSDEDFAAAAAILQSKLGAPA
ncbi:MAG: YcxB family protein [Luteolibacter sp.]